MKSKSAMKVSKENILNTVSINLGVNLFFVPLHIWTVFMILLYGNDYNIKKIILIYSPQLLGIVGGYIFLKERHSINKYVYFCTQFLIIIIYIAFISNYISDFMEGWSN